MNIKPVVSIAVFSDVARQSDLLGCLIWPDQQRSAEVPDMVRQMTEQSAGMPDMTRQSDLLGHLTWPDTEQSAGAPIWPDRHTVICCSYLKSTEQCKAALEMSLVLKKKQTNAITGISLHTILQCAISGFYLIFHIWNKYIR